MGTLKELAVSSDRMRAFKTQQLTTLPTPAAQVIKHNTGVNSDSETVPTDGSQDNDTKQDATVTFVTVTSMERWRILMKEFE